MIWSPQQDDALKSVATWLQDASGKQVFRLFGYAGCGKTTLAVHFANAFDGRVKFASFTGKAALVMRRKGCAGASTIHSLIYKPVERAGGEVEFVLDPDSDLRGADLLIIDECFVAGTMVDTPIGPRPIELLRPGDLILNAGGVDRIIATSRKRAGNVAQIVIGGKKIACSCDHPFFTDRGLVRASELRSGDFVIKTAAAMRLLPRAVQAKKNGARSILLAELQDDLVAAIPGIQIPRLHSGTCKKLRGRARSLAGFWQPGGGEADRSNSEFEPNEGSGGSAQNKQHLQTEGANAAFSWREWPRSDQATSDITSSAGDVVDIGIRGSNQNQAAECAGVLQDRHCSSERENSDRGGRRLSLFKEDAGRRQKENGHTQFARVESVEVLEQSDHRMVEFRNASGECYLYDIQADGHSSFSVEGLLVHNCSMVNAELGRDVLSFGVPVLVLGDPAQLPPVSGAGYFTEHAPDVMLTEVHRQARDNPIIRVSMDIREGLALAPCADGACRVIGRGDLEQGKVLAADQVLVGLNKTRHAYNGRLRTLKGITVGLPIVGDKLVCLRNNREKRLLNGGLWRVARLLKSKPGGIVKMIVKSEDYEDMATEVAVHPYFFAGREGELTWQEKKGTDEFAFGYALTVHKSQGSQWDDVVLFDESASFRENARRWLYTGITRSAKTLTIVI